LILLVSLFLIQVCLCFAAASTVMLTGYEIGAFPTDQGGMPQAGYITGKGNMQENINGQDEKVCSDSAIQPFE
jgi:hypothetical protein